MPLTLHIEHCSDDTLTDWHNNNSHVTQNIVRSAAPDQDFATLDLKAGKNQLLVKVGNVAGEWGFYIAPEFPPDWPAQVTKQLERDHPRKPADPTRTSSEANYYRLVTLP